MTCERTALNLLKNVWNCNTNKQSKKTVKSTGSKSKVFATRKTAPGLRFFDKEAVKIGGGEKHRMNLNEMIMIKDNHLAVQKNQLKDFTKAKKTRGKLRLKLKHQAMQFCAQNGRRHHHVR